MTTQITPEVRWAQRSCYSPNDNYVILTIAINDVPPSGLKLDLQEQKIVLDARSDLKGTRYHLELNLHDDIYPEETEVNHTDRQLGLKLFKAEPDFWWPALLSDKNVPAYVKQDFDRWVNKDAQDGEPDPLDEEAGNMPLEERQAMADAALSTLPVSEHLITHTEQQAGINRANRATHLQDIKEESEGSDEEDEDADKDDKPAFSDDEDSDNEDPPPAPPDGGSSNGHNSKGGNDFSHGDSHDGNSTPQDKDTTTQSSGRTSNDDTGKKLSHEGGNSGNGGSQKESKKLPDTSPAGESSMGNPEKDNTGFQDSPEQSFSVQTSGVDIDNVSDMEVADGNDGSDVVQDMTGHTKGQHVENCEEQPEDESGKQPVPTNHPESTDWATNLDGVRPIITQATRKIPFNLRPLSFEQWKKIVDRSVELSNLRGSHLMQVPKEIRLDIFELAVMTGDPIHFLPQLRPDFDQIYGSLMEKEVYKRNHTYHTMIKARIATAKKEQRSRYYFGDDMKRCQTPGLLHVSRQVSEETCVALYRRNTFAFRDIHGFVALECFLHTIGRFNVSQLRKLDVHVPVWFHGPTLDKLRSTWIFKAAKTFGLEAAMPHKDRVRGSFEACINTLAKVGTLKELNLIVNHHNVKLWNMEYHPAAEDMPNNKKLVYAKRLSQEEYTFEHILAKIPKLAITVVAEESLEDPKYREEQFFGESIQYERCFAAIERKCKHYGFRFERREALDAMRKSFEAAYIRQTPRFQGGVFHMDDDDVRLVTLVFGAFGM